MRGVQRNHYLYARVFVLIIAVQKYGLIWKYNTCIMHMGGLPFSFLVRRSISKVIVFIFSLCLSLELCYCPAKSKSSILALGWSDWAPSLWYAERCWSLSLYLFLSIYVFLSQHEHTDIVWAKNIGFATLYGWAPSFLLCAAQNVAGHFLCICLFIFSLQHTDII